MTLSNFDWTDKESVKWFVLLPTGHEGPYSLAHLQEKKLSKDVQVWSEGLKNPVKLSQVIENSHSIPAIPSVPTYEAIESEEDIPPLPPLPEEDHPSPPEHLPEIPLPDAPQSKALQLLLSSKFKVWAGGSVAIVIFLYLLVNQFVGSQENIELRRLPKMSQALHERILKDLSFEGWDKKLFFKEYVPSDLSHIWLVTSAFQTCEVEAYFSSIKDKLLTLKDQKVAFKSRGALKNHIVEFSKFEFTEGVRILPGLYDVDVRATDCSWTGVVVTLANGFSSPEKEYVGRMKMILYPDGASMFNALLDKLIKKKIDAEKKIQGAEELFWEDLQQKYQTLLAITLQIEQLFLDMLDKNEKAFVTSMKSSIELYTNKYGHFLTQFVIANEEYFKELETVGAKNISQKKTYGPVIRITAKEIGYESMKIIEEFQTLKTPKAADLKIEKSKVLKVFEKLKEKINQKIIQVTEDRSK